jgi:hypothetical protein
MASLTLWLINLAFMQLRAELVAVLAPALGTLGLGALGPQLIDLLLQCAAFAKPLLCALYCTWSVTQLQPPVAGTPFRMEHIVAAPGI